MKRLSPGLGGTGARSVGHGAGMIPTGGSPGAEILCNGPGGILTVSLGSRLPGMT